MKRYFTLSIIAILIIIGLIVRYYAFGTYSEGFRAGRVMKLSKKGMIFKTYEGQLDLGGLFDAEGTATTIWDFSVKDESLIDSLYRAMETGERTRLQYVERFYSFPWEGKTHYFVTNIESVNR